MRGKLSRQTLTITGRRQNANLLAQDDTWSANLPDGNVSAILGGEVESSLPRWLGREAERIARSDAAARVLIARYATIASFRWANGGNLVIFIEYTAPAPCKIGLGADCLNRLTLAVDPAAGTVLDIEEDLGH